MLSASVKVSSKYWITNSSAELGSGSDVGAFTPFGDSATPPDLITVAALWSKATPLVSPPVLPPVLFELLELLEPQADKDTAKAEAMHKVNKFF